MQPLPMASQIEHWPLDKLIPYARNPRTHSDAQVAQIAASINEFGFTNPILVDSKAGIIAGHGRLLGARKLNLATVPVIVLDLLSETQKRAYIIADNKLALNAGWDDELLALELVELKHADYDLNVLGFNPKELDDLLTGVDDEKADDVPPLPEHAVSHPGDLWLCGDTRIQHRVLCGDCTDPKIVERLLADRKPFLMVTDPP
jgi:ParB-like chromosome segregation protein Spo0J